MEESQRRNGLVVPFIIIIILLIGLIGYICYNKFIANNEQGTNKVSKEKSYTYEDIAGVYEFSKKLENEHNEEVKITLYLLNNGVFKYEYTSTETAVRGEIGNYIIKDNKILFTDWFMTTSGSGYNVPNPKSTDTLIAYANINSDKTISYNKCYNDKVNNCKFEKSNESTDAFNNIHDALYTSEYNLTN